MSLYIEVLSGHLEGGRGVMVDRHGERIIDCTNTKSKWIVFKNGVEYSGKTDMFDCYRVIHKHESLRRVRA